MTPSPLSNRMEEIAADQTTQVGGSPVDQLKIDVLRSSIIEALHSCYDPEIPVDIYELGLIYDIGI